MTVDVLGRFVSNHMGSAVELLLLLLSSLLSSLIYVASIYDSTSCTYIAIQNEFALLVYLVSEFCTVFWLRSLL